MYYQKPTMELFMNWLQTKYIGLLSVKLEGFKKVGNNYNFRCPICGDSKRNKSKTRGWVLSKGSNVVFHCFNCNTSISFQNLIKNVDFTLHEEYIKELLLDKMRDTKEFKEIKEFTEKLKVPEFIKDTALRYTKKISQLDYNHPAKLYIENRKIPTTSHYKIFFTPRFKSWVNGVIPNKFPKILKDEPRIIIPLLDEHKKLFGIQGRSLDPTAEIKYMTLMFDESKPKIFGLESLNKEETVYATEGPFDSLFLDNSVASCGGVIESNLELCSISKDQTVIIYDNEPRSIHTIKKMSKSISAGYSVCFWPETIKDKDINDMILSGISKEYIMNTITKNTHKGIEAQLKLSAWSKI